MKKLLSSALTGALVITALPPAAFAQLTPNTMVAHYFDVGQASSVLLEFTCGAVLIDAGAQDSTDVNNLLGYLTDFFARRTDLNNTLETVFITHNHIDHTKGLDEVSDSFKIKTLIEHGKRGGPNDNGDLPVIRVRQTASARGINVITLTIDSVRGGYTNALIDPVNCADTDPKIQVVWAAYPTNPGWTTAAYNNKNNHSLVVRLDYGEASFLFPGDLQEEAIESMIEEYKNTDLLDVDVYHVGHHGSHNATTMELLQAMDWLQLAVISMGHCDRGRGSFNAYAFGHPRKDIVDMLRGPIRRRRPTTKTVPMALGVRNFVFRPLSDAIYATGWDGTVNIRAHADGTYRVTTDLTPAPSQCRFN